MVHDHIWSELNNWKKLPNVEIVAAADKNAPLRDRIQKEYGVHRTYASLQEMLDNEELDIVQAAAENNAGAQIVEACASRGIHVISEKPMAATLDQAERMLQAATNAGTLLMIDWPTAWQPAFQEFLRRIERGDIGEVSYIKYRAAHNGPREIGCDPYFVEWLYDAEKNGAGALMDYCGYAAVLAASVLGLPKAVTGMRGVLVKDYTLPDDNAIILMKYAHAFAVAEASWTQVVPGAESSNPIAYGSEGSLAVSKGKVIWQRPGVETETIVPLDLVSPRSSGPEYFVHCIEHSMPVRGLCSPKVSRDAQEILQAGLVSADTGQTVTI